MKIYNHTYGEGTLEFVRNSEGQIEITFTSEDDILTFTVDPEDELKLLKFFIRA
jgi:hypothetical protein